MEEVLKLCALAFTVGAGTTAVARYFVRNEAIAMLAAVRSELNKLSQDLELLKSHFQHSETQHIERLSNLERRIIDSVKLELLARSQSLPPQSPRSEGDRP